MMYGEWRILGGWIIESRLSEPWRENRASVSGDPE